MNVIRFGLLIAVAANASPLLGQVQNLVTLPTMNLNDSFYESYGVGWSVNRMGPNGGFFFNNPGGAVAPAFGGFDPNAGATFGVGTNNARFNFSANQGSSRSIVSEAPMVMVPNGGGASFFSGSQRPFVTGIVPVVGAGPAAPTIINPLHLKLQQMRARGESLYPTTRTDDLSSDVTTPRKVVARAGAVGADRTDSPLVLGGSTSTRSVSPETSGPVGSISALRKQRAAEVAKQREEARRKILSARQAEAEGRYALARSEFHVALRLLQKDDPWRAKTIECLRELAAKIQASRSSQSTQANDTRP